MTGKMTFSVSGLKEFSAGLEELSKAAQKGVLRRTLLKAGKPMKERARQLAPKDTHDLEQSIEISAKTSAETDAGRIAFGEVMKAGGSKADATAALRSARRAGASGGTQAVVYVGPKKGGKRRAIKAIVQEFGGAEVAPHAYLRPALAATKDQVLNNIKTELGAEIDKAARRAARKALKKAGKR